MKKEAAFRQVPVAKVKAVDAEFKAITGNLLPMLGRYAALPAMAGVMQYFFSRKNIKEEMTQLKDSYGQTLLMSQKLQANPELAADRFQELAVVAPTVAKNPKMAVKFIEPRLKNGLSLDDVHKLTMIQAHAKSSVLDRNALTESAEKAGLVTDRIFTVFGPRFVDQFAKIRSNIDTEKAKIFASGGSMNKQSSQKVSDECLGEMLADRFVMWRNSDVVKTAAVASAAGAAKAGAKEFSKGLAFFAAPLAIAGLVHGIGAMVDAHKTKKLEEEAQIAFNKIKKDSEHIRGNPVLAEEAFDAIKTFAPTLAVKPSILKTFIEHTIKTEMLAPQTVSELASAQSNVHRSQAPGFAQGFMGAVDPAFNVGKTLSNEKLQQRLRF